MPEADAPNPIRTLVRHGNGWQCLARGSVPRFTRLAPTSHERRAHLNNSKELVSNVLTRSREASMIASILRLWVTDAGYCMDELFRPLGRLFLQQLDTLFAG